MSFDKTVLQVQNGVMRSENGVIAMLCSATNILTGTMDHVVSWTSVPLISHQVSFQGKCVRPAGFLFVFIDHSVKAYRILPPLLSSAPARFDKRDGSYSRRLFETLLFVGLAIVPRVHLLHDARKVDHPRHSGKSNGRVLWLLLVLVCD
jgi:hypothetical protein